MSLYDSPGVYIRERDLSQVIVSESATIAAMVGVFKKGPVKKPVLVTSAKMMREIFGDPDASISLAGYCGMNFFEKGGQQLLIQRVAHTDATYGAAVVKADLTLAATATVVDPDSPDWTALAGGSGVAALLVVDVGPGGSSSQKAFQLVSRNVKAPAVTAAVAAGGTLATGQVHNYIVVARNNTLQSGHTVLSATATPSAGNLSINLSWPWDGVATSYDVYRSIAAGAYQKITTVGLTSLDQTLQAFSIKDTGTSFTADATTTVALPLAAVTEANFKVQFFDTTVYPNSPVEVYDVTWVDTIDGNGVQLQIEEQINGFSKRFRVDLNPLVSFANLPVYNSVKTSLSAGASGTAPTASDVANGWDAFADPEEITARVFINGGYSNAIVQLKMIQVATARGDAFAILDLPPSAQQQGNPYAFTDYRRLTLNANTNRAALFGGDILYADTINGKTLYVPPSGYVAGCFAFTDFNYNPAFQPVGLRRGQLPNALGTRVKFKQADRDVLGVAQCNPIVNFPGEGIVPWDGMTLQSERSGFSFISIRRIFDVLELSIKKFLKPEIHDPNDEFTRRSIKAAIEEYLSYWTTQRAIKSFKVDLSDAINPGYVTTLGQLNVHVYVEPIYPTRVIEVTMGLTKAGANFDYLISGNALA
jgi:phage tail sheath protein FI